MPFREVLRYFKHAQIGVAPYEARSVAPYVAESSQKLNHFEMLGVPAVCPQVVVGHIAGRFGYIPGDAGSIASAVRAALACGRLPGRPMLQWSDIVKRLLAPGAFADIRI